MKINSKITIILECTEDVPGATIKEVEKSVGARLGSKEHRELIEERLTEILSTGLGSGASINDISVIGLEAKQI